LLLQLYYSDPEQKKEQDIETGGLVVDVVEDSPADKAGLRENDIITEIDGEEISGTSELYRKIRAHKPGDKISIAYLRNGEREKADVELGESDRDYFLGSLDSDMFLPKLKVGKNFVLPDEEDLKKQFEDLQDEFMKLRDEMQDLRDKLQE